MQPLVSIAMATYNGDQFLRKQLDSVFNQTYKNLEVIVCDDKSSDGTLEILNEYSKLYDFKYYVNHKNIGYLKNFEKAISLCTGRYIALSDQDDIWCKNKIEKLVAGIGRYSLIYSDAGLIDENDEVISESFHKIKKLHLPDKTISEYLYFKNYITGCTLLFDSSIRDKIIPIYKDALIHDWWIGLIASFNNGITYLPETLVMYRQHGNNSIGFKRKTFFQKVKIKINNLLNDESKKKYMLKHYNRICLYLGKKLFINNEQFLILNDLKYYYKNYYKLFSKFRIMIILIKYNKYFFPEVTLMLRIVKIFLKLF